MKGDIRGVHGDVTTVADAKRFWAEWFGSVAGATIVRTETVVCDEHGTVPVLVVRMPDGSERDVPVHEDPEGVISSAQ